MKLNETFSSKKMLKYFLHVEFLSKVLLTHENMGKLVFYLINLSPNQFLPLQNMGGLNYYLFYIESFSTHTSLTQPVRLSPLLTCFVH